MLHGAGILGSRSLGGAIAHAGVVTPTPPPPVRPQADLHIYIRGEEVTGMLQVGSFEITEELGTRGTANFRLIDKTGNYRPDIGAPVRVIFNGMLLFGGTIDERPEFTYTTSHYLFIDVDCVDYNQLADRNVVTAAYEDQTLRDIVLDIIDEQSGDEGERLANEGVTYTPDSIVDDKTKFSHVRFSYDFPSSCFDTLGELSGYAWYIDHNKVFHFHEPDYFIAPITLDDDIWQGYRNLRFSEDRSEYRNLQYLIGGKAKTEETTDDLVWKNQFKGDGTNKVFTCELPLADKPRIWANIGGGGWAEVSAGDIGIRKVDGDGLDWYYQINSEDVSQNRDSAYTALTSADLVEIWFQGFVPILQQGRNEEEIASRAKAEGSTGVYAHVIEEEHIDDRDLARERVEGMLRRHGEIPGEVRFETMTHGCHAGQLLPVRIPRHDLDNSYVITQVSFHMIADDPDRPFVYQIDASRRIYRGSWADWYKRLAKKGRPWQHRENETLQMLRKVSSPLEVSDVATWTWGTDANGSNLIPWQDDVCSHAVIGNMRIGFPRDLTDDSVDDAVSGPLIGLPPHM